MKINENSTIKELLDAGISTHIVIHDNCNLNDAHRKLKPFKKFGKVEFINTPTHTWLRISKGYLSISAFYSQKEEK